MVVGRGEFWRFGLGGKGVGLRGAWQPYLLDLLEELKD